MLYIMRTGRVGGLLSATENVAVAPSATAPGETNDTVIGSFSPIVTLALVFGATASSASPPVVTRRTRMTIRSSPSFRSSSMTGKVTTAEVAVRRIVAVPVEFVTL